MFVLQKLTIMATVILNHRVADYSTWKKGYDSDKERREANGMTEIALGRKAGDPGMVYIVADVKDVAAIQQMFSDPMLQQAMKEAGVLGAPEMTVLEN
jgi:hypothetical protein